VRRATSLLLLCLVLSSCVTSRGRVDPTATVAVWGGAMIVGGAVVGAGTCEPTPEQCDTVERGSPLAAGALVIGGAALIGLAYLFHQSDQRTP
jgi:hypothetical protein